MRCVWFDSVALQNMLLLAENFTLKVLTLLAQWSLEISPFDRGDIVTRRGILRSLHLMTVFV